MDDPADRTPVQVEGGNDASSSLPPVRLVESLLDVLDRFQRRHRVPAFVFGVFKKFGEDRAGALAATIAYYSLFSLFPLLLALVTVLGFVLSGREELQQRIVDSALAQYPVLGDQIEENIGALDGDLVTLAIGLGGALWAGLGALQALQDAMNSVWDVPIEHWPNFVGKRLRALTMLVLLGTGILGSTVVSGFGVVPAGSFGGPQWVVASLVSVSLNTVIFLVAFQLLTNRELQWRNLLPGALAAGVGWAVLQAVGSWFIADRLQGSTVVYGTFAAVIALLSWMYLQARILLFAAEINVVRTWHLWPRSLTGKDLTEQDERALARQVMEAARRPELEVVVELERRKG